MSTKAAPPKAIKPTKKQAADWTPVKAFDANGKPVTAYQLKSGAESKAVAVVDRSIRPIGRRRAARAGVVFPRGTMQALPTADSYNLDTWENLITGLGVRGHDRRLATTFGAETRLDYATLTSIYRSDGLGRIILHRIAGDMTRAWFKIEADTDGKIEAALKKMKAKAAIKKAIINAELYGGSLAVMILDDGGQLNEPVNLNKLKGGRGVLKIMVFDRYRTIINPADLYQDPSDEVYGEPQIYQIIPIFGQPFYVHESRCLRFEGDDVPDVTRFQNQGWADSIFQSCYDRLRAVGETYSNVEHIIEEFIVGVLTIPNLLQMLSEGRDDDVKAYIDQVDQSKHVINSVVVDALTKYERVSSTVSGLKDLVDLILESLAAQKGLPMCLLFGRSQGGLSDDEATQVRFWYDRVVVMQEEKMLPALERLVEYVNISLGMVVDENSPLKFGSLWQPTQKDLIAMRNMQAQTDDLYVQMGAITDVAGTITQSRFGSGNYSFETVLSEHEEDPLYVDPLEKQQQELEAQQTRDANANALKLAQKTNPAAKVETTP